MEKKKSKKYEPELTDADMVFCAKTTSSEFLLSRSAFAECVSIGIKYERARVERVFNVAREEGLDLFVDETGLRYAK